MLHVLCKNVETWWQVLVSIIPLLEQNDTEEQPLVQLSHTNSSSLVFSLHPMFPLHASLQPVLLSLL